MCATRPRALTAFGFYWGMKSKFAKRENLNNMSHKHIGKTQFEEKE